MINDEKRKTIAKHFRNIADRIESRVIDATSVVWDGGDEVETQVVAAQGPEIIFDVEDEELEESPEMLAALHSLMN